MTNATQEKQQETPRTTTRQSQCRAGPDYTGQSSFGTLTTIVGKNLQPKQVPLSLPLEQLRLMTKVATLYHEEGMKQTEVAKDLHISQTRVSRMLRKAKSSGMVRTIVTIPPGINTAIETELEQAYGLSAAVVIDGSESEEGLTFALGAAAAGYLDATLLDEETIGFSSWSATLLAAVDAMSPTQSMHVREVVQVVGGVGEPIVQAQANRLMDRFAENLGAVPLFLPAPGLLETAEAVDNLLSDGALSELVQAWKRLAVIMVGIGSLEPSPFFRASGNAISKADEASLRKMGTVGDICLRYFDATGQLVDHSLNRRVVGISAEEYLAVPRRIAIAGGKRKHRAIKAAVLGGWVTTLVTDMSTARSLLASTE